MGTMKDKKTVRADQAGLVLVGRSRDGRYRYRSVSGKLAGAEKTLAEWERKSAAADRKVEAWRKKVAHAAAWLRRSEG